MKPLKFGDVIGKANAIEEYRKQTGFEAKVKEVMQTLSRLRDLPPLPQQLGKIRDYPPLVHRFSIYVLEEANRREHERRASKLAALEATR